MPIGLSRRGLLRLAGAAGLGGLPSHAAVANSASLHDFGARGDGRHDDGPALRRALAAGLDRLIVPPGRYRLATAADRVTPPAALRIEGSGADSRFVADVPADFVAAGADLVLTGLAFEGFAQVVTLQAAPFSATRLVVEDCVFERCDSALMAHRRVAPGDGPVTLDPTRIETVRFRRNRAVGRSGSWRGRLVQINCRFAVAEVAHNHIVGNSRTPVYVGFEINQRTPVPRPQPDWGEVRIVDNRIEDVVATERGDVHAVSVRWVDRVEIRGNAIRRIDNVSTERGDTEALYVKCREARIVDNDIVDGTNADPRSEGAICMKVGDAHIADNRIRFSAALRLVLDGALPAVGDVVRGAESGAAGIVRAADAGAITLTEVGGRFEVGEALVGAPGTRIRGVEGRAGRGIWAAVPRLTVTGNVVRDATRAIETHWRLAGKATPDVVVAGNRLEFPQRTGVLANHGGGRFVVRDNTVRGRGGDGVGLAPVRGTTLAAIARWEITANRFEGLRFAIFSFRGGDESPTTVRVTANRATDCDNFLRFGNARAVTDQLVLRDNGLSRVDRATVVSGRVRHLENDRLSDTAPVGTNE